MGDLNGVVLESTGIWQFVTAVYGVLDPDEGSLWYVNCGHCAPLILRRSGEWEALESGGMALGVLDGLPMEAGVARLDHGEMAVFYTDGVFELVDDRGDEFGVARLKEVLRSNKERSAAEMIGAVTEATHRFAGKEIYDDDFTLMIVKRGMGLT